MGLEKCFVCFEYCLPNGDSGRKTTRITEAVDECETVNNQLKVVYLLRKMLEIPEDMCCQFLQDYGDPYTWINCCDSCFRLVESSKWILDQILSLEQQFIKVNMEMKQTIALSKGDDEDVGNSESNFGAENVVRSYVKQGFVGFLCVPEDEVNIKVESTFNSHLLPPNEDYEDVSLFPAFPDIIVENLPCTNYPPLSFPDADDSSKDDPLRLDELDLGAPSSIKLENHNVFDNTQLFGTEEQQSSRLPLIPTSSKKTKTSSPRNGDKTKKRNLCVCKICGRSYQNPSGLTIHERIMHTGERPYKCDLCEKSFFQSSDLKRHVRCHTGEKPYKCKFCWRSFTQSHDLTLHERKHTGEKPFTCNVCGKSFAQSGHLLSHRRVHTKEKPYKCDQCGKCYRTCSERIVHSRVHTGERPYKCDICGNSYRSNSSFNSHKRTHSRIKNVKKESNT